MKLSGSFYVFAKRFFDVVIALILLILTAPIFLISIILIKLDGTGGPIFAKYPPRFGLEGNQFKMFKFRTMIPGAHKLLEEKMHRKLKEKSSSESFKIKKEEDSRITWVGKILRSYDFDELPQLLNVVRGDMSIVGPRPYMCEEVEMLIKRDRDLKKSFAQIFKVRPGITGLWQVSGRNNLTMRERIALDVSYVGELSLIKDFIILIKTPLVVITRNGAW
jgi:undecaprenyl-phosphate galactose phosphotransferase